MFKQQNGMASDDGEVRSSNLLQFPVEVLLNYWLLHSIVEACQEDGLPHPPLPVSFIC